MRRLVATVAVAACLALSGCAGVARQGDDSAGVSDGRFESSNGEVGIRVITDTRTGVQYLYVDAGYSGCLTVLVDTEGKPVTNMQESGAA